MTLDPIPDFADFFGPLQKNFRRRQRICGSCFPVFLIAFLANAILMAAGFSSQAVHSGSDVRLDASED